MVQIMGEDKAFDYLKAERKHQSIPKSGAAPAQKTVGRGET